LAGGQASANASEIRIPKCEIRISDFGLRISRAFPNHFPLARQRVSCKDATVLERCSADFQSAVSPICNRQTPTLFLRLEGTAGQQNAILRYGRLKICATTLLR